MWCCRVHTISKPQTHRNSIRCRLKFAHSHMLRYLRVNRGLVTVAVRHGYALPLRSRDLAAAAAYCRFACWVCLYLPNTCLSVVSHLLEFLGRRKACILVLRRWGRGYVCDYLGMRNDNAQQQKRYGARYSKNRNSGSIILHLFLSVCSGLKALRG